MGKGTGKQFIQPTVDKLNSEIPPLSSRIPSQRHMDQSNQSRKLQQMANNYSVHGSMTLPRFRRNTKRAYEKSMPKGLINQDVSQN
jgi:hypothetical protein